MGSSISFEESQYREKVAIWAVLSALALYSQLADNRVWRWFAANIPTDLGTGGHNATDFDVMVGTLDMPRSWTTKRYHAFEVKVAVVGPEGRTRSLKAGKTQKILNQVAAYRRFGVPDVSLLDVFLCLPGFLGRHHFPTEDIAVASFHRGVGLHQLGAGYRVLPFQVRPGEDPRDPPNLVIHSLGPGGPMETAFRLLEPRPQPPTDPFMRLAEHIDEFAEKYAGPFRKQVIYCRKCHQLGAIEMKTEHKCPSCGDDLIRQF